MDKAGEAFTYRKTPPAFPCVLKDCYSCISTFVLEKSNADVFHHQMAEPLRV